MKHTLLAFATNTQQGKVRHTLMGSDYGYIHAMGSQGKDVLVSLPVNVVAHTLKSPAQALDDIQAICQALGVGLEQCVTFEVTESLALPAAG